jgi:hypothetical protein
MQLLTSASLRREMQEDDEALGMVHRDEMVNSVATEEHASLGGTDSRVREDPGETIKVAKNKEDDAEEFDFSLPSKGRRQRKAKTVKQIDIIEEVGNIRLDGKARRRQRVPDMDSEGVSTTGTGKYQHPNFYIEF